jgi:hypothetical protein
MQGNKQPREDEWQRAMREASELPQASIVDLDPEDPAQLLDDAGQFSVVDVDLEVDAEPQAEADAELDAAVATTADDYTDIIDSTDTPDVGDLYGVHVPKAADHGDLDQNADREAFKDSELGEHVFETLEKKIAESGTDNPEEDVEFEDDSDPEVGHHKTDRRDTPVADKGSGGPGGL